MINLPNCLVDATKIVCFYETVPFNGKKCINVDMDMGIIDTFPLKHKKMLFDLAKSMGFEKCFIEYDENQEHKEDEDGNLEGNILCEAYIDMAKIDAIKLIGNDSLDESYGKKYYKYWLHLGCCDYCVFFETKPSFDELVKKIKN